jgi:hypothetical protein
MMEMGVLWLDYRNSSVHWPHDYFLERPARYFDGSPLVIVFHLLKREVSYVGASSHDCMAEQQHVVSYVTAMVKDCLELVAERPDALPIGQFDPRNYEEVRINRD